MTIQFSWAESDYASAWYAWSSRHLWKIFMQNPEGIGVPICGVLFAIILLANRSPDWRAAIGIIFGSLLLSVAYYLGIRWRLHRDFRKRFRRNVAVTVTLDEGGVAFTYEVPVRSHFWVGFTKIYESRRTVVMDTGGSDFIFLPKSAMSRAQLEEFKRLATTRALQCAVTIASP
jgi:hypothetical protein